MSLYQKRVKVQHYVRQQLIEKSSLAKFDCNVLKTHRHSRCFNLKKNNDSIFAQIMNSNDSIVPYLRHEIDTKMIQRFIWK